MTGFEVYKFYLAIKLHFTTDAYDVFESRGRVKSGTEDGYRSKRGHGRFDQLARELPDAQTAVQFFVACYAYGASVFDSYESSAAVQRWKKNKEMMTQLILDDLDSLDGDFENLASRISGGQINIETGVAVNRVNGFADKLKNNFAYSDLARIIKKLDRFVRYNEEKVNVRIKEYEQQEA